MPIGKKGGTTKTTGKSSAIGKAFANIGKAWNKAKKAAQENVGRNYIEEPMQGVFRLTNASIQTIGDNNWLHAAFECVCVSEGDHYGGYFTHRCGLEGEESLTFLIRDLDRLGVEVAELEINSQEDLEKLLKELAESAPHFRAKVVQSKTNDQYQNMRIQKLVEWDGPNPLEAQVEEEEEEEAEAEVDLEKLDRKQLKALIKEQGLDIKVFTNTSDDDIRAAITEALGGGEEEQPEQEEEEEEEEETEVELEKGMAVSVSVRGKEQTGTISSVDSAKGMAKVKLDKSKKLVSVAFGELEVLVEED